MSPDGPARRARLPFAILATLALVVAASPASPGPGTPERPEHVVLVIVGGGVRTKEFLGRPDLLPTVHAIGAAGFSSDGWKAGGAEPTDAAKALLCGRAVPVVTPGRVRPGFPTILEYARAGLSLPADAVWFASYADGDALSLGASDHADFGDQAAPRLAYGEGPFSGALGPLFRLYGRPNPTKERTWTQLALLRRVAREEAAGRLGARASEDGVEDGLRVERTLLEEVDRRALEFSGLAGLDVRAMRAGVSVLRLFHPRLLVIRLGQADVAQKSLSDYGDVLKQVDAELARLRAAIAADPSLARTTTLLVATELGRDAVQNATGGYGRSDGSLEHTTAAVVGEGPGLRRGVTLKAPRDLRDLCPTLGRLLGVPTPFVEGVVRDDLLLPPR